MSEIYSENIIIGAGPAGIQLAYLFKKYNITYIHLEKSDCCGIFFKNFPHSGKLISINKRFTGENNKDFNLRHDWNSLLNDEELLFKDYSTDFYPNSIDLYKYLNDFVNVNKLDIKYNHNVKYIYLSDKEDYKYKLLLTNEKIYYCKKIIIGTGLSIPNNPKIQFIGNNKPKHYADFAPNYFMNKINLKKYENKKVLILGSGNSAYELANILNDYTSNIIILGSNKNMSIVSHYAGDLRSTNLKFLDTFYLKTLNGIDELSKQDRNNLVVIQNVNENDDNYLKYRLVNDGQNYYDSPDLKYFDEIIYCTGWKFNLNIFTFKLNMNNENKYPVINYKYESVNNSNLFFIGSLMHSLDYKKSSGGFIHGFRYLIKFFFNINFANNNTNFKIDNLYCSCAELTQQIYHRINYSSSLYQMFNVLGDCFYLNKNTNNVKYIQDISYDYIINNIEKNIHLFCFLKLTYGEQHIYDIRKLNEFNKYNPTFLHPEILIYTFVNNEWVLEDKIIFEEDLIASFKDDIIKNKINRTLKFMFECKT